ncbi:unnamed protein product [Notodromas monacha]|uniref:Uncharacterized protein n=1 Tax=Notodromas monacha TaxID=399045 RepID=A0A7R9BQH6_9CRUS|nr:unnamed protein product [Notodromas monacha]CAG0919816.1 unnamed protein product [Notodromas monacha]
MKKVKKSLGDETSLSRLSPSTPGKYDHEIFARAQAGDLPAVQSLFHSGNFDPGNADWIDRLVLCAAKYDWPDFLANDLAQAPGFRPTRLKSAFRRACAYGSLGVLTRLLDGDDEGFGPRVDWRDVGSDGKTGLHIACHHGRHLIVEEFLARWRCSDYEGFLEAEDVSKATALVLATTAGATECVTALLMAGAMVTTQAGKSVVDIAVLHNLPDLADLLKAFEASKKPQVTLAKLAFDESWDTLSSWCRFSEAERFSDLFQDGSAFYWALMRGNLSAASRIGFHHGETMRKQGVSWEAHIVDLLMSDALRAMEDGVNCGDVLAEVLEKLFVPVLEDTETQDLSRFTLEWTQLITAILNGGAQWASICSILGSATIALPQMCYGFLRVLPSCMPSVANTEIFKKDFITLVINCISFDRQRSECKRFGDVLALTDKLIQRGDSELSRQIFQFLLQSSFILRLGWYPECLPLIQKFANHAQHLWDLELILDTEGKTSLASFLAEFEAARNEKGKHLFDLLLETDNSFEAVSALMPLGCQPSSKTISCPDPRVQDLIKRARFFEDAGERLPSVAEMAKDQQAPVLLNLLRRTNSPLTAQDVGCIKFLGKTAHDWCIQNHHDNIVKEMHFFLVPIIRQALDENNVKTLSALLSELSSVAFTLNLGSSNIVQMVMRPEYKFPPVRKTVLGILEATHPAIFQDLLDSTTMTDILLLEDASVTQKFLNNSVKFAFDSCTVSLPVNKWEVGKKAREKYYCELGSGKVNHGFEVSQISILDSTFGDVNQLVHQKDDHLGHGLLQVLVEGLKKKRKFVMENLLLHPAVSSWCQVNWNTYKPLHNRFMMFSLLHFLLTCFFVCHFCSVGGLDHFPALCTLWGFILAASALRALWEVDTWVLLSSKLYFHQLESYFNIAWILLPPVCGVPFGKMIPGLEQVQMGFLVFAPFIGSVVLVGACGSRTSGKPVFMLLKTLDETRKLYTYLVPIVGLLISSVALHGALSTTVSTLAGSLLGTLDLDTHFVAAVGPIMLIVSIIFLKVIMLSIVIGIASRIVSTVDMEYESLRNEKRVYFMLQATSRRCASSNFYQRLLIGKPVQEKHICNSTFLLTSEPKDASENISTIYSFQKFVKKLKDDGPQSNNESSWQSKLEDLSSLHHMDSKKIQEDLKQLKSLISELSATMDQHKYK